MNKELEKIKQQHIDSYRSAVIENVNNNTNVLVDEDIKSLLKTPPLDSMDLLKSKCYDLAKKNKIVLDTEEVSKLLSNYRKFLLKSCDEIKDVRLSILDDKISKIKLEEDNAVIKINKKDFNEINKKIKIILKDYLKNGYEEVLVKGFDKIFLKNTDVDIKNKIISEISKYVKGSYQRQLIENFDIKVLVKDTTLVNGVKEQTERYLFTLQNSYLLK